MHDESAKLARLPARVLGCAFDLMVSNRVNLYYPRHLDRNTVGPIYRAITYGARMAAAEHKSDVELTKNILQASYEVSVVGIC